MWWFTGEVDGEKMTNMILGLIGIGLAVWMVDTCQRRADEYFESGLRDYHREMYRVHGDKYGSSAARDDDVESSADDDYAPRILMRKG